MPVEIKELVIRAVIGGDSQESGQDGEEPLVDTQEIIATCVEQILEILEKKQER